MSRLFIRLFYSTKCKECMNIWQVIYNEGIARIFIPLCLDNFTAKQISTISIREIPAIVISQENQPPTIFEGPVKCSQWLNNFIINRRKNMAMQIDAQRKLIQKEHALARKQDGGVLEFNESEMEGITDCYAYHLTDLCQPKNYIMVGDENKYNIITPTLSTDEYKIDDFALKKYLSELETSRNNDNQEFIKTMEHNQIRSIINHSNVF